MHQKKHQNYGNQLKEYRPCRNVIVLFKRLVKPIHPKHIKYNISTINKNNVLSWLNLGTMKILRFYFICVVLFFLFFFCDRPTTSLFYFFTFFIFFYFLFSFSSFVAFIVQTLIQLPHCTHRSGFITG